MATFTQIKDIRLKINDPAGVINIIETATLPLDFNKQTAYLKGGKYFIAYEDTPTEHVEADLYLSDETIGGLIDLYSSEPDKVVYECYQRILSKLGHELRLKSLATGTESTEYLSLKELAEYYKSLIALWQKKHADTQETGAGLVGSIFTPTVAGGNV